MDLGLAWRAVWSAPNAFGRLLIYGLLMLIPLVGTFVLYGLTCRVAARTRDHEPDVLPPLSEFGKVLGSGLGYFLIALLLMLPFLVVLVPFSIVIDLLISERATRALGIVLVVLFYLVIIPLSLVLRGVLDFALLRYVQTGRLRSGLNLVRVFTLIPQRLGDFLLIWAVSMLATLFMVLGFFAFLVGGLLTVPFGAAFFGHALGQLARQPVAAAAQPAPGPAARPTVPLAG